jgi:tetratricopeptide (TPR) repeat protein
MNERKRIVLTGFVGIFFIFSVFVTYGKDISKIFEDLEKVLPQKADWLKDYKQACTFLKQKQQEKDSLNVSIGAGFSGDEAQGEQLSKLNVSAELSKGFYPNVFSFATGNSFEFKKEELVENVTSLNMKFVHYLLPEIQGYAYIERRTDSYMSIQQRYDIGGGVAFEIESPVMPPKASFDIKKYNDEKKAFEKLRDHLILEQELVEYKEKLLVELKDQKKIDKLSKHLKKLLKTLNPKNQDYISKKKEEILKECEKRTKGAQSFDFAIELIGHFLGDFEKEKTQIETAKKHLDNLNDSLRKSIAYEIVKAFKKKNAMFLVGLSCSFMAELEKAAILSDVVYRVEDPTEPKVMTTETIELPSQLRYRIAICPYLTFRPTSNLTFIGYYSWKLPLRDYTRNDSVDYRRDAVGELQLKLPAIINWAKNVLISFEYQYHYDHIPPAITSEIVTEYKERGGIIRRTLARRKHSSYSLKIKVVF